MPRPSRATDRRLIQAAKELLPETGFGGLKLRRVAARAGVNLGMFYYHFRSKQEFTRRVMSETYETIYRRLELQTVRGADAEAQLRGLIRTLVLVARENRHLLLGLAQDILAGYQPTLKFLEENFHRHVLLLMQQIKKCQAAGVVAKQPLEVLLPFLIGALAAPNLFVALLERTRLKPAYEALKRSLLPRILAEGAMEKRLDLAWAAIRPQPAGSGRGGRKP